MSRPLFLNPFCSRFFVFSICRPLQFLIIDSPSTLNISQCFLYHITILTNSIKKYLQVHTPLCHHSRPIYTIYVKRTKLEAALSPLLKNLTGQNSIQKLYIEVLAGKNLPST